ncbi:MAG: eukaryotic translation initiation factor 5a [Gaeavirus sp.]|uniref:Eukaryotic translation initiation factor 5a n=1 Tax=Gaeavirus sp. TaxID=2487767 RepID=A0A3G4ZY86_9VIRU|nr:MAG: eukaryotic translation initiation factor 5a [Gaeavirus sp.]
MDEDDDFNYDGMDKISVGSIKLNMVVMLKCRPCRITYYHAGKTGKHGAAKAVIKGTDIITDKHYEHSKSTSKDAWLPVVKRVSFKFVDYQDGYLSVIESLRLVM